MEIGNDEIGKVLQSFPDTELAKNLFSSSDMFRRCVIAMANGVTPQQLIMDCSKYYDDLIVRFQNYVAKMPPPPIIISKEDIDKLKLR